MGNAPTGAALQEEPAAWAGVTHGLVEAFREWLMAQGYAVATVNRRLSTIKQYAQMGDVSDDERQRIADVTGFGHTVGR